MVYYSVTDQRVEQIIALAHSLLADNAEHVAAVWPRGRWVLMERTAMTTLGAAALGVTAGVAVATVALIVVVLRTRRRWES